jgi:hypothetical protein
MKKLIFILFTPLFAFSQFPFIQDLEALKTHLTKTKSYKAQSKKLTNFTKLYESTRESKPIDNLEYIHQLSQILTQVNDKHLGLYENPKQPDAASNGVLLPKLNINLDSLALALEHFQENDISGIYKIDLGLTIGLFQAKSTVYYGVVIESSLPHWQPGEIAVQLNEYKPNFYHAIAAHPLTKNYIFYPNERFSYGLLTKFYSKGTTHWYKKNANNYVNLPAETPAFLSTKINDDLYYIRIGTFQRNQKTSNESALFHQYISENVHTKNVIIDLRNHSGGARSETKKYKRWVRKFKGNVIVLTNYETLSQAEIFILSIANKVNLMGQPTKGMLTYGSNYGKRIKLPSGNYTFYPTDMRGRKKLLKYEGLGITPQVYLNPTEEWVSQAQKKMVEK